MTPFFRWLKGRAMATNFMVKIGKSDYLPLFVALAFYNGLQYRHSDFRQFIRDDLATLRVNLVNFGPVTLEFSRVKGIHTIVFFFKIKLQTNYLDIHETDFHQIFTVW